ncbi:MAG: type I-MYXAN CRISPR-associated protein Cmx8 [Planctomycetaceae bacterium]|nr:type I-MYXAN CRISPR-associated protein Cmx8 [Planctomycetaceae bacterium]
MSVTITYDLFDLPTAQHKAGLAGLLLQIDSMKARSLSPDGIPEVIEVMPSTATVRFTGKSVQGLFDDLYDATVEEVVVKSKWQGAKLKREEEVEETDEEGKKTTSKRYIYEQVQPCGHFLRQHLPKMDPAKDWHKLWRDMLWNIPRGIPMTRIPFELRAGWITSQKQGGGPKSPCKEGREVWEDLLRVERAKAKGDFYTTDVASSLWLGAQATNAEAIPFQGRAEQTLLLHFWPLTALVFAPQQIDADGQGEFVGYVLAIPEVADLENFRIDYPLMLNELDNQIRGYRPAEAVLDLPAQGALVFLEHLARLAQRAAGKSRIASCVGSIEFLHLAKFGNNVKSMAAGRVAPRPELLDGYRAIVGQPGKPSPYRNPLFRRGLMLALLNGEPWHHPFGALLSAYPWPHFVRSDESPRGLPWFWLDAARMLQTLTDQHTEALEVHRYMTARNPETPGPALEKPLAVVINRLIRSYLYRRAEERSGVQLDKYQTGKGTIDWEKVPAEFNEWKQKLAQSTFLEFRSRRDQAFVDHFVATFCSVKQYLSDEDYRTVADALLDREQDRRDDVKTLTLLALSANS